MGGVVLCAVVVTFIPFGPRDANAPLQYRNEIMSRMQIDEGEPSFNLRLIEAVKNSRCLYDSSDRQYRSHEHKIKLWNRFVQFLQFDGDHQGLYSRWKQLRDKYGKEKKKMKTNGIASTWQYFKHLTFLDPYMSDRQPTKTYVTNDGRLEELSSIANNPAFNQDLISEVKKHTCLFDIRDPKYRHNDCRNLSWQDIITALDFPGNEQMIYKQWKKLRDRYVREKKRLRSLPPGVHEESSWDLYDLMKWMDPYLDDRSVNGKKRKAEIEISDEEWIDDTHYMVIDKRTPHHNGDVLLDGDSAFAASVVSDLRSLPERDRQIAKEHIEDLLQTKSFLPHSGFIQDSC
ncbi:unnamed protein product, partial [Mesorhabditis belari]|uniref:MADF domain-containing protein n=1 Tax=Mesorhabditis belari TaxID=2138241 RepID=A0AAF3EZZ2_9BILA